MEAKVSQEHVLDEYDISFSEDISRNTMSDSDITPDELLINGEIIRPTHTAIEANVSQEQVLDESDISFSEDCIRNTICDSDITPDKLLIHGEIIRPKQGAMEGQKSQEILLDGLYDAMEHYFIEFTQLPNDEEGRLEFLLFCARVVAHRGKELSEYLERRKDERYFDQNLLNPKF